MEKVENIEQLIKKIAKMQKGESLPHKKKLVKAINRLSQEEIWELLRKVIEEAKNNEFKGAPFTVSLAYYVLYYWEKKGKKKNGRN